MYRLLCCYTVSGLLVTPAMMPVPTRSPIIAVKFCRVTRCLAIDLQRDAAIDMKSLFREINIVNYMFICQKKISPLKPNIDFIQINPFLPLDLEKTWVSAISSAFKSWGPILSPA